MPLCHRHQLQYLSAHVVGESPKCQGSTRDGASDDSQCNHAAEAVSRLSPLLYRKEVNGEVFCTPGSFRDTDSTSL